jgi:hypothetical protein
MLNPKGNGFRKWAKKETEKYYLRILSEARKLEQPFRLIDLVNVLHNSKYPISRNCIIKNLNLAVNSGDVGKQGKQYYYPNYETLNRKLKEKEITIQGYQDIINRMEFNLNEAKGWLKQADISIDEILNISGVWELVRDYSLMKIESDLVKNQTIKEKEILKINILKRV